MKSKTFRLILKQPETFLFTRSNNNNIGELPDYDTKSVKVWVCDSADVQYEEDCEQCPCAMADCTQYDFDVWMYFDCNDVEGNYVKLTNDNYKYLVSYEVEAIGCIVDKQV